MLTIAQGQSIGSKLAKLSRGRQGHQEYKTIDQHWSIMNQFWNLSKVQVMHVSLQKSICIGYKKHFEKNITLYGQ